MYYIIYYVLHICYVVYDKPQSWEPVRMQLDNLETACFETTVLLKEMAHCGFANLGK